MKRPTQVGGFRGRLYVAVEPAAGPAKGRDRWSQVVTMVSAERIPAWFHFDVGPNEGPIRIGARAEFVDVDGERRCVVRCTDHAVVGLAVPVFMPEPRCLP